MKEILLDRKRWANWKLDGPPANGRLEDPGLYSRRRFRNRSSGVWWRCASGSAGCHDRVGVDRAEAINRFRSARHFRTDG